MATNTSPSLLDSGYKYILAYGILLAVLIMITRFRIGYNIVYYGLALSVMLVVVVESKFIKDALAPISTPSVAQDQVGASTTP